MSQWSLPTLLGGLHEDIQRRLSVSRATLAHPSVKGNASESIWLELFTAYLPMRYSVVKGHVVDSEGHFSDEIDVLIFDRQYTPFIFRYEGQTIVPAEGVYAAIEAKQTANKEIVQYAQAKIASVRALKRTSLPIPHAGGVYPPKVPGRVLGGLVTFESDWSPPMAQALLDCLRAANEDSRLELGCVASHGVFLWEDGYVLALDGKPAAAFLFELIARLQAAATAPMIDIRAYARWLSTNVQESERTPDGQH